MTDKKGEAFGPDWMDHLTPAVPPGFAFQKSKVEPNSTFRQIATTQFELFTAYVDAGFTEQQALSMLGSMMAAVILGETINDD